MPFSVPVETLPVKGTLTRFAPPDRHPDPPPSLAVEAWDSLGVRPARIEPEDLDALFALHAPVLEMDVAGAFDLPGSAFLGSDGVRRLDTNRPLAYRYAATMPFAGRLRLQLTYVFWFPERPRTSPLDTLGGRFDGLVWRVTLDDDGEALLYDSIHPCGCYHQFFPGQLIEVREGARDLPEPPLIPKSAPVVTPPGRIVLRVATATHYLQQVYAAEVPAVGGTGATRSYGMAPYARLYAVGRGNAAGSFFDARGRVPGSERGERFYLWPMGVPSPGAMRDRGRQATAFLGRRHFDDADLLDTLFRAAGT
jgi:hypothetical protein